MIKSRTTYHPGSDYVSGQLLTKQSFREGCDINFIVRQHAQTGMFTHLNPIAPTYGDNSAAVDLQTSIQAVRDAQANFEQLPAAVRQAASHSPVQLLEMLGNEEAFAHLVDVGLPVHAPDPASPPGGGSVPPSGPPPSKAEPAPAPAAPPQPAAPAAAPPT